ncbi:MAG: glycosyltransferase, partial [Vicinamibacteria bacterium]|nr:glycosyltransferase [Vicinamibacteria bacterium]
TIVIPARNEESSLPSLIHSLLAQTARADEILVVDAGSTDRTGEIGRLLPQAGLRVISVGRAYPGRARNCGIAAARHEWIALIDAGCVAEPQWLEELWAEKMRSQSSIVFGGVRPRIANEWDVAQALVVVSPQFDRRGTRAIATPSMLIHRPLWHAMAHFPEHLRAAEDLIFFERLTRAGVPLVRSSAAMVEWTLAPSPAHVFRRLRLYSAHHIAAGFARTWHLRVMAMDIFGIALLLAGLAWRPAWLMFLFAAVTRLIRTIWARRDNIADSPFRGARLLRCALLLGLADTAVWCGASDYLRGAHKTDAAM